MARPLRIQRPGGRYHVTARGNERESVYRRDSDRFHFIELLAEATERFGVRIHVDVLMDNHFRLMADSRSQPEPRHAMAQRQLQRVVQSQAQPLWPICFRSIHRRKTLRCESRKPAHPRSCTP
jgi:REP element-mobilizing transposase RayT